MDTQRSASILVGPNMSYGEIEGKDKRNYSVRVNSVLLKVPIDKDNADMDVKQRVLVDLKKRAIIPLNAETTLIDYPEVREFLANLDYSRVFGLILFESRPLWWPENSNHSLIVMRGENTHLDDLAVTYLGRFYPEGTSPVITGSNGLVGKSYITLLSLPQRRVEKEHGVLIAPFEGLVEQDKSYRWKAVLKPSMLEYCVEHTRIRTY